MEGVETKSAKLFFDVNVVLRRLSPLWRGLRLNNLSFSNNGILPPKTIPVMEGVETTCWVVNPTFTKLSEDYPRYGGG